MEVISLLDVDGDFLLDSFTTQARGGGGFVVFRVGQYGSAWLIHRFTKCHITGRSDRGMTFGDFRNLAR